MKLIAQESLLKTVDFHGVALMGPKETRFLAAAGRGNVTAYAQCAPELIKVNAGGYWWGADDCPVNSGVNTLGEVGRVDLEGMDWRTTCVEGA